MNAPTTPPTSDPRDPRLDFFRALALLLIYVAHTPGNSLAQYRPGCFGFSDSADIFVFVSGYAAALAYGKIFRRAGILAASARVLKRCAELYACHLGLFFVVAGILVGGNHYLSTDVDYVKLLNLTFFFEHTPEALEGLFTLTYVPNYFDILPMYMVAMAMLPAFMLLARVHLSIPAIISVALYLSTQFLGLELPAEIAFQRPWFFNPFAWQMLFYTGFFLGSGWLHPPPAKVWLTAFCAAYVLLCIPLSHYPTYSNIPWLKAWQRSLEPLINKTDLGILRWLHFMCLAHLAVVLFKGREKILRARALRPLITTGQQALPVFLTGMVLSQVSGMALDLWRRTFLSTLAVNATSIALLIMTAHLMAWFKSQPWRGRAGR